MSNEFEKNKQSGEFLKAAKDSIIKPEKPKTQKRKKKDAASELREMFVKAGEIRKKVKKEAIKTKKDELVIKSNGEYVPSDKSYAYRFAYFKLKESLDKEKLLTGKVESIEDVGGYWTAVLFMDEFKVMIPIFEFLNININVQEENSGDDSRIMMSKRLGSTIDFVVKHMDEDSGVVIASRKEAMQRKSDFFYKKVFGKDYLINQGDVVKGRVVATAKAGVNIEVMGVEVFIPSKDVSKNYVLDSSKYFSNGEEVDVKVTTIYQDPETGDIEIEASINDVKEDVYDRIKDQVVPGKKYVGEIVAINTYGVFVNIKLGDFGLDVLCAYPSFGNLPTVGANVTINITDKNEKGFYGIIQHIAFD